MSRNKPPIYLVANEVWPKGHCYLPFGIMYVGSALKTAGWEVKLFHLHLGEENLLYDAIKQKAPLFVGISTIIGPTLRRDIDLSRGLKKMGQTVVWGGVFASMVPELVMADGAIDYVVKGEAEKSAPRLAESIFEKAPPIDIPGVAYFENGQLRVNPGCDYPEDLDKVQPGWELIDPKKYLRKFEGRDDYFWQIFFSRGCPNACAFCYNRMDDGRRVWRSHSLSYWKEQLAWLEKTLTEKIGVLALAGDNAFGDAEKAWELIQGLGRTWSAATRLELVNEEFVRRARATRAVYLGFGLESGSDRMLKIYNKDITAEMAMDAAEKLAAYKCLYDFGVIFFGPGETVEDRRLTVEFMEKARYCNPYLYFAFNSYWAFPQTPLWQKCLEQGFREPADLDEWSVRFNNFMEVHGWDRKMWARTASVLKLLYGFPAASGESIPGWARKILYRRLHNFKFNLPVEEALRFVYRNYLRLANKPAGSYSLGE